MSSISITPMTDEDYYSWSLNKFDTAIQNKLKEAKLSLEKMPDGKWKSITSKDYELRRGSPKQLEAAEKAAALMVRRQHVEDAGATKDLAAPRDAPTGPMRKSAIEASVARQQSLEDKVKTYKRLLEDTTRNYEAKLTICTNELIECKQALQTCRVKSYQELGGGKKFKKYRKKSTKRSKKHKKKSTKKNTKSRKH